jgi:ActR/RegA family two-component response regulator
MTSAQTGGQLHVLIVEDIHEMWVSIANTLSPLASDVTRAASLVEALEAARAAADREAPFGLVVIDKSIPTHADGDPVDNLGVALARAIYRFRLVAPGARLVVYTAFETYSSCVAAIKAGADAYVPKMRGDDGFGGPEDLLAACRGEAPAEPPPPYRPSQAWLRRNVEALVAEHRGHWMIALPVDRFGDHTDQLAPCETLGDHVVVVRPERNELRDIILASPELVELMPQIALLSGRREGEE